MAINTQEVVRSLISYTVVTDKSSLVRLLERNGIQLPNNPSDKEVTVAVLAASSKSENFKRELAELLSSKVPKAGEDFKNFAAGADEFGFTGLDDFSFTGIEGFANQIGSGLSNPTFASNLSAGVRATQTQKAKSTRASRVSADNPQGKTGVGRLLQSIGRSLTSQETINSGVQLGLNSLNNRIQGRQNQIQTETTYLTQQQDQIRQDLSRSQKTGMSAMTWVFIGVGVVALAGIIYFVAKKKK
jgi:LPXTG-motif cell wall-anchored protein